MRSNSLAAALAVFCSCLIVGVYAQDVPKAEASKNVIRDTRAGFEAMAEGPLPQEQFESWWAPVAKELMTANTFFNVVTEKAHSGTKSLRIALTPETSQKWLANPGKPGFESLWVHYTTRKNAANVAGDSIVFSCWAYVEKGEFRANVKVRARDKAGMEALIGGAIQPTETGKWVQLTLDGDGKEGAEWTDIRLEIECPGDFVVYLDDFYVGPPSGMPKK